MASSAECNSAATWPERRRLESNSRTQDLLQRSSAADPPQGQAAEAGDRAGRSFRRSRSQSRPI